MKGVDATKLFCPEFTVPVIRLIKKNFDIGEVGVIKTKEARALLRLQEVCAQSDWNIKAYQQTNDMHYIAICRGGEL